mgnify:CR=1 FL=1|jgi:hypothetical protein
MANLKIGDKVIMNDKYWVSAENKGKVWTVDSEPWECCGTTVVKLEGKAGGYAVDGLDLMPKYIDSNSFLEYEEKRCKNSPLIGTCSFDNATLRGELVNLPAADVEPIRHGYWEVGYFHDRVCSCCLHPDNDLDDYPHPYCPNCGAKMDKKKKSEV